MPAIAKIGMPRSPFLHQTLIWTPVQLRKDFNGHAQIREFFESAPDCLGHHATGFYSEVDSNTRATARLKMLTLFKRNTFTVDYDWELNKVDGEWKIATQSFSILGKQDLSVA